MAKTPLLGFSTDVFTVVEFNITIWSSLSPALCPGGYVFVDFLNKFPCSLTLEPGKDRGI